MVLGWLSEYDVGGEGERKLFDGFHKLIIIITNDVIHTHSLASLLCVLCALICSVDTENYEILHVFFSELSGAATSFCWFFHRLFFSLFSLSPSRSLSVPFILNACSEFQMNSYFYESTHSFTHCHSLCCFLSHFHSSSLLADDDFFLEWILRTYHQCGKILKSLSLCSVEFMSVWLLSSIKDTKLEEVNCSCCEIVCHKNEFIFLLYYE